MSPRGLGCNELLGVTVRIEDARSNLFVNDVRNIAYRFAVAEWLWIYFGRNDVATIAPYNPKLAQFSDDGVTFAGAYGPPIWSRWANVLTTLGVDPDTRQAVLQIPRVSGPTRDQPCTLSVQFLRRHGKLHGIVTMRSSDAWLGIPYDVFTFSMLLNVMAGQLGDDVGSLIMQLGSSHLYERDDVLARRAIDNITYAAPRAPALPGAPPPELEEVLVHRVIRPDLVTPWTTYAGILLSPTNVAALEVLCRQFA